MKATEKLTKLAELTNEYKQAISAQLPQMTFDQRPAFVADYQKQYGAYIQTIADVINIQSRNLAIAKMHEMGIDVN